MSIVKHRKIFFTFSILLIALSVFFIFSFGFNLSIDFRGGTLTEIKFENDRPSKDQIEEAVASLNLGGFSVRPYGEQGFIIRTKELSSADKTRLSEVLEGAIIERQNTIGPVAGAELQSKAIKAVLVVILMILVFITFAFRKVSRPVASWKYGLATIIALLHDVIIPVGVFVLLGKLYGMEIDILFVSGLLAVLGYSVHDTIVVFDRVRENLRLNERQNVNESFEHTVGRSVDQTMGRSINTSVTLIIVLLVLYFIGPSAIREFSLLLIIGVVAGTYSSIFLASPLLVTFYRLSKKHSSA